MVWDKNYKLYDVFKGYTYIQHGSVFRDVEYTAIGFYNSS
jgi:hypothetical protein